MKQVLEPQGLINHTDVISTENVKLIFSRFRLFKFVACFKSQAFEDFNILIGIYSRTSMV